MEPLAMARHLTDVAYDAWREIEHRTDHGEHVGMGADGTATTKADRHLDDAVLECAKVLGISVLSEEAGFIDHGSDLVAVVDPLDGSRNAGRGLPFFCTSVAVGTKDVSDLQAGVVKNLVTGDVYAAERGAGATFNRDPIKQRPFNPDEVMVAIIADSILDEVKQEQERRGHHLRDLGSAALELCLVGTGALDAFLVRQPWLRVIDIAAGVLIVEEVGGTVIDPKTGDRLATPFNLDVRCGVVAAHTREALGAVS